MRCNFFFCYKRIRWKNAEYKRNSGDRSWLCVGYFQSWAELGYDHYHRGPSPLKKLTKFQDICRDEIFREPAMNANWWRKIDWRWGVLFYWFLLLRRKKISEVAWIYANLTEPHCSSQVKVCCFSVISPLACLGLCLRRKINMAEVTWLLSLVEANDPSPTPFSRQNSPGAFWLSLPFENAGTLHNIPFAKPWFPFRSHNGAVHFPPSS